MKPCTINLAERRGGNRVKLEFGIDLVDLSTQFFLDPRKRDIIRKRRDLILQFAKRFHKRQRQKIGTRSHRLSDLDKRRPKLDQLVLQPDGLPFLIRFFVCVAAYHDQAQNVQERMEEPNSNGVQFFAKDGEPSQPPGFLATFSRVSEMCFFMDLELVEIKIKRKLSDDRRHVQDTHISANTRVTLLDIGFFRRQKFLFGDQLLICHELCDRQLFGRNHRMASVPVRRINNRFQHGQLVRNIAHYLNLLRRLSQFRC